MPKFNLGNNQVEVVQAGVRVVFGPGDEVEIPDWAVEALRYQNPGLLATLQATSKQDQVEIDGIEPDLSFEAKLYEAVKTAYENNETAAFRRGKPVLSYFKKAVGSVTPQQLEEVFNKVMEDIGAGE